MLLFVIITLIELCYYVKVQLLAGTVIKALHAGAFKDALTFEILKLAAGQKHF